MKGLRKRHGRRRSPLRPYRPYDKAAEDRMWRGLGLPTASEQDIIEEAHRVLDRRSRAIKGGRS